MKKRDLISLYNTLQKMDRDYNIKLSYCIARNLRKLEDEYKAIMDIIEPGEEFKAYIAAIKKIQKDFILKDDNGNSIPGNTPGTVSIDIKNPDYQKQIKQVNEQHQEIIKKQSEQDKRNETFLNEEIEVDCYKVNIEYLPENISPGTLMALDPILQD